MHKSKSDILDPKLREAYERVMNTKVHIQAGGVPDEPEQKENEKKYKSDPFMTVNDVKESPAEHKEKREKKGMPLPIILVGVLLFAGVYTVICASIIGVKIPFLPF